MWKGHYGNRLLGVSPFSRWEHLVAAGTCDKAGSGLLPYRDDKHNLNPVLRASTNQVLVNERTLLGALGQGHPKVAHPRFLERDNCSYVEARGFLVWLSQYLAMTQAAEIPFPNDLARAVKNAAGPPTADSREPVSFESLTFALEGWFDKSLPELPAPLRKRVEDNLPMWDGWSPDQRRNLAMNWDGGHDPATMQEQQFGFDLVWRQRDLEKQVAQWEAVSAPTAGELAQKEKRLAALRQELARIEWQQGQVRGNYHPERKLPDSAEGESSNAKTLPEHYIPYPRAMMLFAERLNATPEEMAAWVFTRTKADALNRLSERKKREQTPLELENDSKEREELARMGPKDCGLAAYWNANEPNSRARFYYSPGDFDYLGPLMACWFREDDIATFDPVERYITYKALIDRWSTRPEIQPKEYILAKIRESRLASLHPIYGGTQGNAPGPGDAILPPLESGLFKLSQVKKIEEEDGVIPPYMRAAVRSEDATDETVVIATDTPVTGIPAPRAEAGAPADHAGAADCAVFRAMPNLTADELSISFVADKFLVISAREKTCRVALAVLGLIDRRSGNLRRQAGILLGMARGRRLKRTDSTAQEISRLRGVFEEHLGIKDDPFDLYRIGAGWEPRFKLNDKRNAADERAKREGEFRTVSFKESGEHGVQDDDTEQENSPFDSEDDVAGDWLEENDPNSAT
jgi:hypothetical protein